MYLCDTKASFSPIFFTFMLLAGNPNIIIVRGFLLLLHFVQTVTLAKIGKTEDFPVISSDNIQIICISAIFGSAPRGNEADQIHVITGCLINNFGVSGGLEILVKACPCNVEKVKAIMLLTNEGFSANNMFNCCFSFTNSFFHYLPNRCEQ